MSAIAAGVRDQSKSSELWRRPSVTVARLTLESYVRRGWILFDMVAVVVVLVALCYPFQGATASFYGSVGLALGAVAVLGTVILARPAALVPAYDAARLPAILSALLSLARLPLLPVSTVFTAGAGGSFDWPALTGLAVEAAYVGVLAVFAGFLLEKRELLLH